MSLVSIVIPARNEEKNITYTAENILRVFDEEGIDIEVLVIDDGSSDQTAAVVKALSAKDRRVRLVTNSAPHGIGNAIRRGLKVFRGDMVIIAMADSSDSPDDMIRYVRKMEEGHDCCFGTRWVKDATVKGYPLHKLFLNRVVNFWISLMFGISYNDTTNAFKCYSREVIQGIKPILSHHFNITVELPLKAIVRGYKYAVIPTDWRQRKFGRTSLHIKEMGSRYLFIILYVFFERLLCKEDYQKRMKDEE